MQTFRAACGSLLVSALFIAGCSKTENRIPTFPVMGRIQYNGTPLAGAAVTLVPVIPNKNLRFPPSAISDKDGVFRVKTYAENDGAPAGEYKIILTRDDEDPNDPSDAFRGKFNNPKKPPAKFIVHEQADGEQEIPPMMLTGPSVKLPVPMN